MLITPRPGVHRDSIAEALRQAHEGASNMRSASSPSGWPRLLKYLEWVTDATRLLQNQISAKDVDRLILTRRYYALLESCGMLAGTAQQGLVNGLVEQEITDRIDALEAAMTTLHQYVRRWLGPMRLVVADSSFYLHSPRPLADTDFHDVMGLRVEQEIHLLFPIVVVDELDQLKETVGGHARWRAGHTLGRLDEAITSGTTGILHPAAPGEGRSTIGQVTAEIILDPPGHTRQPIADDEIIERAATIQSIAGREVCLLTCDTGQATRARMAGLEVTKLPTQAGTGDEPPRHVNRGDQPRGTGGRGQQKDRQEAEARDRASQE